MPISQNAESFREEGRDTLTNVLSELSKAPEAMNMDLIDQAISTMEAPEGDTKDRCTHMLAAIEQQRTKQKHTEQRRMAKYTTLIAAGLLLVASVTYGTARAFKWSDFFRFYSPDPEILAIGPADDDTMSGYVDKGASEQDPAGSVLASPLPEGVEEMKITSGNPSEAGFNDRAWRIRTVDALYQLTGENGQQLREVLEKYPLYEGELYTSDISYSLCVILNSEKEKQFSVNINRMFDGEGNPTTFSMFIERDPGKTTVHYIDDIAVAVSPNLKNLGAVWTDGATQYSVSGRIGEEELLEVVKSVIEGKN